MSLWHSSATMWLAQVAASALPDTIVTKTVAARPGWFETVSSVASGLVSITLLVLTAALVPAAWNFRKTYKRVSQLLDRVYGDVAPIVRHASATADNVAYITAAARADVQDLRGVVAEATGRMQEAVALAEERLHALAALLEVAQEEAQDAFVTAAATMRGVRQGARALRRERGADSAILDDDEEAFDGYEQSAAGGGIPRPRIRPRSSGPGGE